jgi:hypothetical protein
MSKKIPDELQSLHFDILTLSPIKKAIPFGIRTFLDLHLDWVVMQVDIKNAFNNIFQVAIFIKLQNAKGLLANIILFTQLFFGVHSSLYYQMGNTKRGSPLLNHFHVRGRVTPQDCPYF